MYRDLIMNVALLVSLTILYNLLYRIKNTRHVVIKLLAGVLFGIVAIAGMEVPFHYAPGVIYDGRSIVLTMAGLFGGGTVVMVSVVMAGIYRFTLGGNGVWAGITTILSCALVGLVFRRLTRNRPMTLGISALYAIGFITHIVMLACQLLVIPWPAGLTSISHIWLPILLIFPVATMLMGVLLRSEDRRLEAEVAQRESDARFKQIFDNSSVGNSITFISGEIHVNQALCEMLAYTKEELQNKKWQDITHPDDIELTQQKIDSLLTGEVDMSRFSKRFLKKDGSVVWADVSSTLQRDEDGNPLHLITGILDITERKQAEDRIGKLNRLYRVLSDINQSIVRIPAGVILFREACLIAVEEGGFRMAWIGFVDAETGNIMPFAQAGEVGNYLDKLKISIKDNLTGRGPTGTAMREGHYVICNDIEHSESMKPWREDALRHGYRSSAAFPLKVAGKMRATFNLFSSDINSFDAEEIQLMEELAQDLSFALEAAEKDEKRKEAEEALSRSQVSLQAILQSTADGILAVDRDNKVLFSNSQFQELWRIPDELVASREDAVLLEYVLSQLSDPEEFLDKVKELYHSSIESLDLLNFKDGRVFERVSRPLFREGVMQGRVWSFRDITDRKQAEDKIVQLNASLEKRVEERTRELRLAQGKIVQQEKMAVVGQLASGVGHELRNPLGIISNSVDYLKMVQGDAAEKVKQHLGIIAEEVHHATRIVNDLLDYARVIVANRKPVSISELVKTALRHISIPENILVNNEIPSDVHQVIGDPLQIQQILENLITNSCDAIQPGEGTINISARKIGRMLAVTVIDTGEGILPENLPNIFQPLYTTRIKGIGLGLAVCRKLAEANGGRMEVKSKPGKGSTFTLYLPVVGK